MCKHEKCTVSTYELAPLPVPAGGPAPPDAVTIRWDTDAPDQNNQATDSDSTNARDALLDKLIKDMEKAQRAQCDELCTCIRDEEAAPTVGTYTVPIIARYKHANGVYKKASGTVRIRITDTPGKCFSGYGRE